MFDNAVTYVHHLLRSVLSTGDVVVDATLGNGWDAAAMAGAIGADGVLYGFDVQQIALDVANVRLRELPVRSHLFLAGHETMAQHIATEHRGHVAAVTFNLGYLPGGDKDVTTHADTTLQALRSAAGMLRDDGLMTVVCYRHAEGERELQAVRAELSGWQQIHGWTCIESQFVNQKNMPPIVFVVTKRRVTT